MNRLMLTYYIKECVSAKASKKCEDQHDNRCIHRECLPLSRIANWSEAAIVIFLPGCPCLRELSGCRASISDEAFCGFVSSEFSEAFEGLVQCIQISLEVVLIFDLRANMIVPFLNYVCQVSDTRVDPLKNQMNLSAHWMSVYILQIEKLVMLILIFQSANRNVDLS